MPRAKSPRWASLAEAVIYSKTPRSTLRRWIAIGLLPAYRLGPRLIQVDLNDIDALRLRIPAAEGAAAVDADENEPAETGS